ncbi:hypothetical protein RvY_14137 [Ramazzottius varieornatus]|uniref:Uncharacterized protein n=1 Tax=Ramazzottius varieornatus TaxID=947166 RepID=A0A1D1VQA0_RAMVA|nr:hypothetical protein RvY_14137 [Ramazzottius varieornatus]
MLLLNFKKSYKVSVLISSSKIVGLLARQRIAFHGTKCELKSEEMKVSTGHELFDVGGCWFSNFGVMYLFRMNAGDVDLLNNISKIAVGRDSLVLLALAV